MIYRSRIVHIEQVEPGSEKHGQFRIEKGIIYLSIDRTFSSSDVLSFLKEHWIKDIMPSLIQSLKSSAKKEKKDRRHQKNQKKSVQTPPSRYCNDYPSQKARIIYTPMYH